MHPRDPLRDRRFFRGVLLALAVLTVLNLLLTASVAALAAAILILAMVWGIRRGDYPLTRALGVLLPIYGTGSLVIAAVVLASGREIRISALLWLLVYAWAVIVIGFLLRGKRVQSYLKDAKPPERKKSRFHFFHGGWRDL